MTIVFSATAIAQAPRAGSPSFGLSADFVALDRNGDGFVSRVEALADREIYKRFNTFDLDRDGKLSSSEYALVVQDRQNQMLRDLAITARVKAALLAEKNIPSLSISVRTYEGGVQLSGFVPAPDIVSRAGRLAAKVDGVRTVSNNITVK